MKTRTIFAVYANADSDSFQYNTSAEGYGFTKEQAWDKSGLKAGEGFTVRVTQDYSCLKQLQYAFDEERKRLRSAFFDDLRKVRVPDPPLHEGHKRLAADLPDHLNLQCVGFYGDSFAARVFGTTQEGRIVDITDTVATVAGLKVRKSGSLFFKSKECVIPDLFNDFSDLLKSRTGRTFTVSAF